MLIGAMNHPGKDVLSEIEWMGEVGLDFIDLTIEPPMASVDKIDLRDVRTAIKDNGLQVVGHTAYYLPLCSPFETIRRACVEELARKLSTVVQEPDAAARAADCGRLDFHRLSVRDAGP